MIGSAPVLRTGRPVTLLGGGPVDPATLAAAMARAPELVAADGGADTALAAGHMPSAVIGDMDSISPGGAAAIPADRLHEVAEQDSTDFEKCLRRLEAPLVLAVGFAAGRLDHALAVCNALVRWPDRRCVVLGPEDVVIVVPPWLAIDLEAGTSVSLFPMGPARGRSSGLTWPIDGLALAPDGCIGTSNRATGPVTLSMDTPRMLLLLPVAALDTLLAALSAAPRWPEPACRD